MNTHDKHHPSSGATGLLALLAMTCLLIIGNIQPASANTYEVTSSLCNGGGGTLEWAVQQANANPGPDIINIYFGLEIDGDSCSKGFWTLPVPETVDYYMVDVTDSLTIEGNGARIIGHMGWVDSSGNLNGHEICPWSLPGVVVTNIPPGFMKVGKFRDAGANAGLTVTVKNLNIRQLNSIARVNDGASLILDNVNASDIWSVYHGCGDAVLIGQNNVNVTLKNSRWDRILTWSAYLLPEVPGETIVAESGNLNVENSKLFSFNASAVSWSGTPANKVNVVTTEIFNSGGIAVRGDATTNVVNSLFYADPLSHERLDQRFVNASSGPMNLIASTFLFVELKCDQLCQDAASPGYFYSTLPGGAINFQQSAVGVGWPGAVAGVELLKALSVNPNIFSADQYTYMQPDGPSNTPDQLKAITNQSQLLTSGPAFTTDPPPLFSAGAWATPLSPGVLIGAVPNAGSGGANELKSPIDNQPILLDVFGIPRVNVTNNTRNIGALQYSGTPVLSLDGTGDGLANLSWTRPPDPPGGTITGYYLYYRVKGHPDQWGVHDIGGASTLNDRITGLTNGLAYEFWVAAVVNSTEQQSSNIVTGTPYGPVGIPVVSGTPGNNQIKLFWTEPDLGAHPGPLSYFVVYRVKGQTQWITGPGYLSARTTTIPGLIGETEYEFGVTAQTSDGAISPNVGMVTATPFAPVGIPVVTGTPGDYQVVLSWTQPSLGGHPGPLTYAVSYRPVGQTTWLPGPQGILGLTATIMGLTAGTPYEFAVVATASDGDASAQGTTTATPGGVLPALSYSSPINVYEWGLLTIKPTTKNLAGNVVFYVTSGSLPMGIFLNQNTGVIDGRPFFGGNGSKPEIKSYPITITLTQTGDKPAQVSAALTIQVFRLLPIPNTYTLTVNQTGTGSGTVGGGGTYPNNTLVTPTATAAIGSTFAGWTPTSCGAPFALTANTTCTATFTLNGSTNYTITATSDPQVGGSVSCTPNPVNSGETSTCIANANAGYSFNTWAGDCAGQNGMTCTLANVTSPKSVTARFVDLNLLLPSRGGWRSILLP